MTTLTEIAQMTDIDRVTRLVADAANRMRLLEVEAEATFAGWMKAQAEADKVGLVADLKLGAGVAAALSEFKQRLSREESKQIAAEELAVPTDGWSIRATA